MYVGDPSHIFLVMAAVGRVKLNSETTVEFMSFPVLTYVIQRIGSARRQRLWPKPDKPGEMLLWI